MPEHASLVVEPVQSNDEDTLRFGKVERDNSLLGLEEGSLVLYHGLSGKRLSDTHRLLRWEEVIGALEE